MLEIRIHGRGGQGAVLASLALARAAFRQGYHVQSFPEFGVERRGAPVLAFLRASKTPIFIRSKVYSPNQVLVLDPSLLDTGAPVNGLKPKGLLCLNFPTGMNLPQDIRKIASQNKWTLAAIDGSSIAARLGIGTQTSPIANTVMAGAFLKASNLASLEHLLDAVAETFPENAEKNMAAAREGYEQCRII